MRWIRLGEGVPTDYRLYLLQSIDGDQEWSVLWLVVAVVEVHGVRVRGEGFGEHLEAHRPALWAAG